MDWLLVLEAGEGQKRFSRPAIEVQVSEQLGPVKLGSFTRLVDQGWNSQRFEITGGLWDGTSLTVQYFTGDEGHGKDTIQIVSKAKVSGTPFILTASYSPNAFGSGERYRMGAQAYYRRGDVSAWAWVTIRHLPRFNRWDQEGWYQLNYHLNDKQMLSLRRFDSDFFGDNVTLRVSQSF